MDTPGEGAPPDGEAGAMQLLAKVLVDAASPGPHAPRGDLFEGLTELEQEVLRQYWGDGRPSGDGSPYFDEVLDIRLRRLRKKARNETWGELVWLAGKVVALLLVAVAVIHYLT